MREFEEKHSAKLDKEKNVGIKIKDSLGIHEIIDQRIHHGVRHCAPIKCQKNMLDVRQPSHIRKMVGIQKVDVVRQPACAKNDDENYQHPYNMKNSIYKKVSESSESQ